MSKAKGSRVQPLPGFFAVAALSAAAACYLQALVGKKAAPYISNDFVSRDTVAYAAVFVGAFFLLSFLHKHVSVRFSAKAQGEPAKGITPRLARFFLAVLVFAAPLFWMQQGGARPHESLQGLIAQGESRVKPAPAPVPAVKEEGKGYDDAARAKMDALMETMDDAP